MRFTPIKVGERRSEQPVTFGDGRLYEGRVVYVHRSGRWYTVEFEVKPSGPKWLQKHEKVKMRECFFAAPLPGIQPMERANGWKRGIYKA